MRINFFCGHGALREMLWQDGKIRFVVCLAVIMILLLFHSGGNGARLATTRDDVHKSRFGVDQDTRNTSCQAFCSFADRRRHLRHLCRLSPSPVTNARRTDLRLGATANLTTLPPALGSAWIDPPRRTLGCLMPKVSSTAWVQYLMDHSRGRFEPVLLSDVQGKYATWTKYLVVKHPLQRLVSAYYEVMVRRKPYTDMSWERFAEQLASREILDWNPHWSTYASWCYPCQVEYDMVLRVETMDRDLPLFNKAVGISVNATLSVANPNKSFKSSRAKDPEKAVACLHKELFKYDSFIFDFHKKHPNVLKDLLDIYKHDLELFGYHWYENGHSDCSYGSGASTCC